MTSACLALGQLLISGVPMPGGVLWASLGLFVVSALMEGAITVAAVRAIERLNPAWVAGPRPSSSRTLAAVALAALIAGGRRHAGRIGRTRWNPASDRARNRFGRLVPENHGRIGGLILIFALCYLGGKLISRRRSA